MDAFISGIKWKVLLLKPEYIKTVMTKTDIFTKHDFKYLPLLGKALLTSTGEDHRRQKKIFSKAFSMSQMSHFVPVFSKHAKTLAEVRACRYVLNLDMCIWKVCVKETRSSF